MSLGSSSRRQPEEGNEYTWKFLPVWRQHGYNYLSWSLAGGSHTRFGDESIDFPIQSDVEYNAKIENSYKKIRHEAKRRVLLVIATIAMNALKVLSLFVYIFAFPETQVHGSCSKMIPFWLWILDVSATVFLAAPEIINFSSRLSELNRTKTWLAALGWFGLIAHHIWTYTSIRMGDICDSVQVWLPLCASFRGVQLYTSLEALDRHILKKGLGQRKYYAVVDASRLFFRSVALSIIFGGFLVLVERINGMHSKENFLLSSAGLDEASIYVLMAVLTVGPGASTEGISPTGRLILGSICLFAACLIVVRATQLIAGQGNATLDLPGAPEGSSSPLTAYSWYAKDSVHPSWKSKQLVIVLFSNPYVSLDMIRHALTGIFNPDCGASTNIRLVVFCARPPAESEVDKWDQVIGNPSWLGKVVVMCGSGLCDEDLERAYIHHAEQVFVLNSATDGESLEQYERCDDRAIVQTDFLRRKNNGLEIFLEVFCPQSRHRGLEAGADHVFCVLGVLYQVTGRALSCPGLSDVIQSKMFPATFPEQYWGMDFIDAAAKVFEDFGVIPFAVAECFPHELSIQSPAIQRRVLLNPGKTLSVQKNRTIFCFSPSVSKMYNFLSQCSRTKVVNVDQFTSISRVTFVGKQEKPNKDDIDLPTFKYSVSVPNYKDSTKVTRGINDVLLPSSLKNRIPGSEHIAPSKNRKIPIRQRRRKQMTGLEMMATMDPSRAWLAGADITDHGQPLWSMWGEGGEATDFSWQPLPDALRSGFSQHTVICAGCNMKNVHYIIQALRSTDNTTWTPIVILGEEAPPTEVSRMTREEPYPAHLWPHVYFVKGSCRCRKALIRAAVTTCRDAIILPENASVNLNDRTSLEGGYIAESNKISCTFFTVHEIRKLNPRVTCSVASDCGFKDKRTTCCPLNDVRKNIFRCLHNPFVIPLIGLLTKHSPAKLGERDSMCGDDTDKPQVSNTLRRIEQLLDLESLIRECFLRRKGIPPYLLGKSYRYVMATFTDKFKSLPIAVCKKDGSVIMCPSHETLMTTGDSILCLVPMEYDQFVAQAINVVRHAQGTEKLKERHQLLRSTNQTIGKQFVALESMLQRVQYAIRRRNEVVDQLKSGLVGESHEGTEMIASAQLNQHWNDNEARIEHHHEDIQNMKTLLNAIILTRRQLRENQQKLKGIALEKDDSVDAAEVVFQQVAINESLISILEDKCESIALAEELIGEKETPSVRREDEESKRI